MAVAMASGGEGAQGTLLALAQRADHSWLRELTMDPESDAQMPNKVSRQVKSGHYVRVKPDPLPLPQLVVHSEAMADALGLSQAEVATERFAKFFSGDMAQVPGLESWATPYALSIMGKAQYHNCPFGNGNGYGDGRAISVGEVVVDGQRWEMQLKGGGTTPFCRGGDGRAVLRSSVREFLASEAMWALGIHTTRALSLVVSGRETSNRPWYSEISPDDPRLAALPTEQRQQVLSMMGQPRNPDRMITEACAITTRVAPSFLRVGHVDLFARRARGAGVNSPSHEQLRQLVAHAVCREFPEAMADGATPADHARVVLEGAAERLAALVAGWLRVGFCQGNFNSDNCLVGGRTMDYGPFGWMDVYDPMFAKWVGSGQHFAFLNQPNATLANYQTLAESLMPLLGDSAKQDVREAVRDASDKIGAAVDAMWREKLGFKTSASEGTVMALWDELEPLMRQSQIDWTLFWRQLAVVAELDPAEAADAQAATAPLADAFYGELPAALVSKWADWLRKYHQALGADGPRAEAAIRMRSVNPKYVPREWMLVEAYDMAAEGDYSLVRELNTLFKQPYAEQPEMEAKYYRRAPDAALTRGGTAFMS